MKISDSIRKEQPETGRQKGSALGLAEMNSDGKPCSGVRGDHEVSTEFFEENQGCFFGLRKISGERCIGSRSPAFFILSVKRKNPKRILRFFVLTGIFLFCRLLFAYCGCGIKGVVAPQHIGQLDKCLFFLGQRSLQSFFNMQEQRLHVCTQTLRLFRQHGQWLKGIRLYMFGMRNGKDFCRIGRIVQSIVECFLLRQPPVKCVRC